jgi:hypothetical protein
MSRPPNQNENTIDAEPACTAGSAQQQTAGTVPKGFARVPTEFVGRILGNGKASIYALHLLAIKFSNGGSDGNAFVLNEIHVRKHHGIGRRQFRAGIGLLKRTGVLTTRSRRRGSKFAQETLASCGDGFVQVPRSILHKPSRFVAFYVAVAVSPKSQKATDAARRIGLTSRTTVRGLVAFASHAKLVAVSTGPCGATLVARLGHVFEPSADPKQMANNVPIKKVPTKNVLTDFVPTHADDRSRDRRKPETRCHPSPNGNYGSQPLAAEPSPLIQGKDVNFSGPVGAKEAAWSNDKILGWIQSDKRTDLTARLSDDEMSFDTVVEIECLASDDSIAAQIRTATRGRVHPDILSPAGAYGIRLLTAVLVEEGGLSPDRALNEVLKAIEVRVGDKKGAYLNSLKLIALRVGGHTFTGGRRLFSDVKALLADLASADIAHILDPRLFRDQRGLKRLLNEQGDEAIVVIRDVLRQAMVDGRDPASIKTWAYFEPAIIDARVKRRMTEEGLRPGDVFGVHRRKGGE